MDSDLGRSDDASDSIIGQFGVGFYSSFIVSNHVEVLSKTEGEEGVRWVSDGSGDYEISSVQNLDFERGTKIVLRLENSAIQFCREKEVEKIIKKYSVYNKYPIKLNGNLVNNLQAIWYKDKREVTQDEYEMFYENLANTKIPYKYRLHYSTDVPLAIKALFYIPNSHAEKTEMMQEQMKMDLYSRKVMIKENCRELIPNYLRFVKGIVDCEDLPLNISRETYQDSNLIAKLRNVVTRRILKFLEDEMKRDPVSYNQWFNNFQQFLKEGVMSDQDNKDSLLRLMRYNSTFAADNETVSLDDYIKSMKEGQKKIYFVSGQKPEEAQSNPFMEPFKDSDVPVLVVGNQVDEMIFQQINTYKSFTFVNVETGYEEISQDLNAQKPKDDGQPTLPEEDVTQFLLWLKENMKPYVGKVTLSKRISSVPMVLFGQVSSSMRVMMQMMQQNDQMNQHEAQKQLEAVSHNQTLEINPSHPMIIKLNTLRQKDSLKAEIVSKQLLDNALMSSGVPHDMAQSSARNL